METSNNVQVMLSHVGLCFVARARNNSFVPFRLVRVPPQSIEASHQVFSAPTWKNAIKVPPNNAKKDTAITVLLTEDDLIIRPKIPQINTITNGIRWYIHSSQGNKFQKYSAKKAKPNALTLEDNAMKGANILRFFMIMGINPALFFVMLCESDKCPNNKN